MSFIRASLLEGIYRSGRFKQAASIQYVEAYSAGPGCPPEVIFKISNGNDLGECWQADLQAVLDIAEREHDSDELNPNLAVLRHAYNELAHLREDAPRLAMAVQVAKANTVMPFTRQPS